MKKDAKKRQYDSPLRRRHMEATKEVIMEGVARVIEEDGLDRLSFAGVAKSAGVTSRTIFRHFSSKDDLLAAFWAWMNQQIGIHDYPSSPEELVDAVPLWFSGFGKFEKLFRAYMISKTYQELKPELAPFRRKMIRACLKERLAGLDDSDVLYAKAAVSVLFSAYAWASMRDMWGISHRKAGEAASWAIQIIIDELKRRQIRNSKKKKD
jgi:AcrR family transcriptional regulator